MRISHRIRNCVIGKYGERLRSIVILARGRVCERQVCTPLLPVILTGLGTACGRLLPEVDERRKTAMSQVQILNQWSLRGSEPAIRGSFAFFRNRNLYQGTLRFPDGFALGRSETAH